MGLTRCKIKLGKSSNSDGKNKSFNSSGKTSSDFVSKISIGETKSFNVKKDRKFATPAVEDLIPEDEYIIKI